MTVMIRDAIGTIREQNKEDLSTCLEELGCITDLDLPGADASLSLAPLNKRPRTEMANAAAQVLVKAKSGVHVQGDLIKNMGHALVRAKKLNQNLMVEAEAAEKKFCLMKRQAQSTNKMLEDCKLDLFKAVELAAKGGDK